MIYRFTPETTISGSNDFLNETEPNLLNFLKSLPKRKNSPKWSRNRKQNLTATHRSISQAYTARIELYMLTYWPNHSLGRPRLPFESSIDLEWDRSSQRLTRKPPSDRQRFGAQQHPNFWSGEGSAERIYPPNPSPNKRSKSRKRMELSGSELHWLQKATKQKEKVLKKAGFHSGTVQ